MALGLMRGEEAGIMPVLSCSDVRVSTGKWPLRAALQECFCSKLRWQVTHRPLTVHLSFIQMRWESLLTQKNRFGGGVTHGWWNISNIVSSFYSILNKTSLTFELMGQLQSVGQAHAAATIFRCLIFHIWDRNISVSSINHKADCWNHTLWKMPSTL